MKIIDFNKFEKSDLIRKFSLIREIASYNALFYNTIFSEIATFFLVFIIFINVNYQLLIFVLIYSFLIILISFFASQKNSYYYKKNFERSNKFYEQIYYLINSSEEIKFDLKDLMFEKIETQKQKSIKTETNFFINSTLIHYIKETIKISAPIILIYLLTLNIFNNQISLSTSLVLIGILNYIIEPLESFTTLIVNRKINKINEEQLFSLLKCKIEPEKKLTLSNEKIKKIKLENVSFSFNEYEKLFHIPKLLIQESLIVKGGNAIGKSTFLKILASLLTFDGNYTINNKNINDLNFNNIRSKISYCSDKSFFPKCSLFEFITQNDDDKIRILSQKLNNKEIINLLKYFNLKLQTNIQENGKNLSLGQKQFIRILPSLIFEYDLMIFDEAFENINKEIFNKIKKILSDKDNLIIETSHSNKYISKGKEINFEHFISKT